MPVLTSRNKALITVAKNYTETEMRKLFGPVQFCLNPLPCSINIFRDCIFIKFCSIFTGGWKVNWLVRGKFKIEDLSYPPQFFSLKVNFVVTKRCQLLINVWNLFKLTVATPEWRDWCRSSTFVVDFEKMFHFYETVQS